MFDMSSPLRRRRLAWNGMIACLGLAYILRMQPQQFEISEVLYIVADLLAALTFLGILPYVVVVTYWLRLSQRAVTLVCRAGGLFSLEPQESVRRRVKLGNGTRIIVLLNPSKDPTLCRVQLIESDDIHHFDEFSFSSEGEVTWASTRAHARLESGNPGFLKLKALCQMLERYGDMRPAVTVKY